MRKKLDKMWRMSQNCDFAGHRGRNEWYGIVVRLTHILLLSTLKTVVLDVKEIRKAMKKLETKCVE